MKQPHTNILDYLTCGLAAIFVLDRLWKIATVTHFFHRPSPPQPTSWPTISILQSITRGVTGLPASLRARARLDYPAEVQHLLICDAHDSETQAVVRAFLAEFPALQAEVILVESDNGAVATKIRKLQAALPKSTGEVICFIDDDVAPRCDTLRVMIPYLFQPGVGAAFALPCHTSWQTTWSSLLGGFVNTNLPLNLVSLTYLTDPIRITGQFVAFRRSVFIESGGLDGLEHHVDDDYEITRRLRMHGLRSVQTPVVAEIDNQLHSLRAYLRQFKRWMVLPRQGMVSSLTPWQGFAHVLSNGPLVLPSFIALLALFTRSRLALSSLIASLGVFTGVHALCETLYLKRRTPLRRWPLLIIVALFTPLQVIWALLSNNEVEWRGQRFRVRSDGKMEVIKNSTINRPSVERPARYLQHE